jgi:alkanesulfonate monooxygenase SsuD/methylene tetrahydromethanopterin reductase-like flavin-dependent oxidoreductase (luciferase family)
VLLAEQITNQENGVERPCGTLDTAIALALMAAVTERIGLVGTASTTYNEPYELARRFATLDHLSRGRAGWNSIATQNPTVANQFGRGQHPDHEGRYDRAGEFIDVVCQLRDSWEENALIGDKASGLFGRAEMVHEINYVGKHFSVRGRCRSRVRRKAAQSSSRPARRRGGVIRRQSLPMPSLLRSICWMQLRSAPTCGTARRPTVRIPTTSRFYLEYP